MSVLVLAATFGEVFKTIVGVILALSGLGVLLMGVIALADRSFKSGTVAAVMGAVLLVVGLWLVGAIGA
jgi:hypothetical protein